MLGKIIKSMFKICYKEQSIKALEHVLIDGENIVATDTRLLIRVKHELKKDDLKIKDKAIVRNPNTNSSFLELENGLYNYHFDNVLFPVEKGFGADYKRIIPSEKDYKEFGERFCLMESIYRLQFGNKLAVDYQKLAMLDSFQKELDISIDKYRYIDEKNSFSLKGKVFGYELEVIIMPYMFN